MSAGERVAFDDLREFVRLLEKEGELARVKAEVDPDLEITEVADRMVKSGGPALLFERVKGSNFPVLINALGSERRVGLALGVERLRDLESRAEEVLGMLDRRPQGILDKLAMLPKLKALSEVFPETVRSGACQEVVEPAPDLGALPILRCWPQDAGRFITMPMVFSRDPESGRRNAGMYRLQVYDARTTGMHWHRHHGGAQHYRRAEEKGEKRIEVAAAIGADPASVFCAAMPLPPDLDEMAFSGFLRGKSVPMVKCRTVDLEVPASSEFVLEGFVEAGERRTEGPFGDHTGFYSLADEYPVFHLTAITRRKDAVTTSWISQVTPSESSCIKRPAFEAAHILHLRSNLGTQGIKRVVTHEPLIAKARADYGPHVLYRTLAGQFTTLAPGSRANRQNVENSEKKRSHHEPRTDRPPDDEPNRVLPKKIVNQDGPDKDHQHRSEGDIKHQRSPNARVADEGPGELDDRRGRGHRGVMNHEP